MNRHSIEGKVAVVTGGAKNLGGLLSRALAEKGAKAVVVHYNSDSSRQDAEDTVAAVQALGAQAIAVQADLSKPGANAQLFDAGIQAFGGVDIAINTAGIVIKKPILEVTEEDFDKSFDVNAKAAFFFIKAAGEKLNDHGKLVTIVSSLLAAYTPFYAVSREQGCGGALHPRCVEGVRCTWHQCECAGPRADGYPLLLPCGGT